MYRLYRAVEIRHPRTGVFSLLASCALNGPIPPELRQENDLESQIKQLKEREQRARERAAQAEAQRAAEAQQVQKRLIVVRAA